MKSHSSVKRSKFLTQFFTYLFMIVLSIIVVYPILITVSTAFKAGNVSAFSLDLSSEWTLNNFSRLFNETLYGSWYVNTLIIAIFTMVCQVTIITLAGYTYSRYRFIGR
ncbi:MAG: sugar ABC transporter permease, partial [Vagococcus sp.]